MRRSIHDRFRNEGNAELSCAGNDLLLNIGGDHCYRHPGIRCPDARGHCNPIDPGHVEVDKHDVDSSGLDHVVASSTCHSGLLRRIAAVRLMRASLLSSTISTVLLLHPTLARAPALGGDHPCNAAGANQSLVPTRKIFCSNVRWQTDSPPGNSGVTATGSWSDR
jgi:hypothetical protein